MSKALQHWTAKETELDRVPTIVHEVLRSPGQPLEAETRAFFEPGFGFNFGNLRLRPSSEVCHRAPLRVARPGDAREEQADEMSARTVDTGGGASTGRHRGSRWRYDFSSVRLHADTKAAESAAAIDALAYTVGRDIVFGAGQYAPGTMQGKRLLAHELTHVVQQSGSLGPLIQRKIGPVGLSGCSVGLGMDIGIYGSRATAALAAKWQSWLNALWKGTASCHGNSAGTCTTSVNAKVVAHPGINWWWSVPEANSAFVREPGYRSRTNRAIDSGDWAENEDDRSIAHEVGHLMGQGDKYWDIPFTQRKSQSAFVNDIMANYYLDPGPTEYGPALTRILEDKGIDCRCCLKYPPCTANNCALNPGLPCSLVGERRHCEWIRASNTPEALAKYTTDCSRLTQ